LLLVIQKLVGLLAVLATRPVGLLLVAALLLLLDVLGWLGAARHHAAAAPFHERGRTSLSVAATTATTATTSTTSTTSTTAFVLVLVAGVDAGANHQDQNKGQGRQGRGQKLQGRLV
jgi:hypothetical protein